MRPAWIVSCCNWAPVIPTSLAQNDHTAMSLVAIASSSMLSSDVTSSQTAGSRSSSMNMESTESATKPATATFVNNCMMSLLGLKFPMFQVDSPFSCKQKVTRSSTPNITDAFIRMALLLTPNHLLAVHFWNCQFSMMPITTCLRRLQSPERFSATHKLPFSNLSCKQTYKSQSSDGKPMSRHTA